MFCSALSGRTTEGGLFVAYTYFKIKLSKKEFGVLFGIVHTGIVSDLERSGLDEDPNSKKIILKFDKLGLIKIDWREGEIYGFMKTKKGEEVLYDPIYKEWFNKLHN